MENTRILGIWPAVKQTTRVKVLIEAEIDVEIHGSRDCTQESLETWAGTEATDIAIDAFSNLEGSKTVDFDLSVEVIGDTDEI